MFNIKIFRPLLISSVWLQSSRDLRKDGGFLPKQKTYIAQTHHNKDFKAMVGWSNILVSPLSKICIGI